MVVVVVLLRIDADDVLRDMFRAGKPNERDEPAFISLGSAFELHDCNKLIVTLLALLNAAEPGKYGENEIANTLSVFTWLYYAVAMFAPFGMAIGMFSRPH